MQSKQSRTIIIDTNSLLRYLLNDIPKQAIETRKLLSKAKRKSVKVIVPQLIVFELNYVLSKFYGVGKAEVVNSLTSIVSAKYLNVESREVFIKALRRYKEESLSLVDCFIQTSQKPWTLRPRMKRSSEQTC